MKKVWSFRASVSVSAKGGEKLAHSSFSVIFHAKPLENSFITLIQSNITTIITQTKLLELIVAADCPLADFNHCMIYYTCDVIYN